MMVEVFMRCLKMTKRHNGSIIFNDVSNYTNRSPYPMIHILRESSLDKAIEFYGNTETIPKKNIQLMHQLGLDKIKQLIQLRDE